MTSISQEWEDKYQCIVYAENKETGEVYRCNPQKAIADIQSELPHCSREAAEIKLLGAMANNPISLSDCLMWTQMK